MNKTAAAEPQDSESVIPEAGAGADIIHLPDGRQRTKKVTSGSDRRKRQHTERFRTDDAEHEALHEQLRVRGLSLGEYVMQLAKIGSGKIARPRRGNRAAVDNEALTQAVVAFNRAGNNQNQIARALNELLLVAHEQSSARLASQIEARLAAIDGIASMFAEPMAAIMAALNRGGGDPSEGHDPDAGRDPCDGRDP
jgi:hypothetical protein